jgi:hypothetical protein
VYIPDSAAEISADVMDIRRSKPNFMSKYLWLKF